MTNRTVWIVTPEITVTNTSDEPYPTPPGALDSLGAFIERMSGRVRASGRKGCTVLLTDDAATTLGLLAPGELGTRWGTPDARTAVALASLERFGWKTTQMLGPDRPWMSFYARDGRPTVHVGLIDTLDKADPDDFPFASNWWSDTARALGVWEHLTGHAWENFPPVMGVELINRTMPRKWREGGGHLNPVRETDTHTPADAYETVYTPDTWRRILADGGTLAAWDRNRAGLTACATVPVAPDNLSNGWRKWDSKRAGWWLVEIPAWNLGDTMPHPFGDQPVGKRRWVTTPTMILAEQLADQGVLAMPRVHDSWTGHARQLLAPFQRLLERAYQDLQAATYGDVADLVELAIKRAYKTGIGMLENPDSSRYRKDYAASVRAQKRTTMWRDAWRIGQDSGLWPVAFDDDTVWYPAQDDPETPPPGMKITDESGRPDVAGGYHYSTSRKVQH